MATILTGALLLCGLIFAVVTNGLFKFTGIKRPRPPLTEEHSSDRIGQFAQRGDWDGLRETILRGAIERSADIAYYPYRGGRIALAGRPPSCERLVARTYQLNNWVHEMGPDFVIRAIPARNADGRILGVLVMRMQGGPVFMDREKPYFYGSWYASCAIAGLLVCWLSVSQGRRLSAQLEQFTSAAVQLAEGELPRLEEPVVPRELGQLARAFNSMAMQLEERRKSLEQARDRAQSADDMRREFTSEIAHSLGTPLSAVQLGLAQLKQSVRAVEKTRVEELEQRLDWLGQTTHRLLKLACWEVVEPEVRTAPMALVDPIVCSLEALETRLLEADIHVILGRTLGLRVVADSDALRNVFTVLLENCVQHSGGHCRLLIESCLTPEGKVEVLVADTGVGMTEETRRRAGERYFSRGRTGLGLAIAKRLLGAHSSELQIESTPGQGTAFRFALAAERTRYE